jgi:membrane-associated phospholipid phosphatase
MIPPLKKRCLVAAIIVCLCFPAQAWAKTPELFRHLGNDLEETFTAWPAAVLLGGAIVSGGLSLEDSYFQSPFQDGRHLGKADTVAGYVGEVYTIDGGALLVYGAGLLAHNKEVARTGEALLEALFFTEAATMGLKLAVHRDRPDGGNYSFPSAHAARTFAVASVLEVLHGPAAGIPAYLAAAFISFTRMDMNVHYLSDIAFGAALGSAFGFGTALFHKHERERVRIVPLAGATWGAMVNVTF